MGEPDPRDLALIDRALRGDATALAALVKRLMPVLFARVRRACGTTARAHGALDVDDLVQEVWLALVDDDGKLLRAYDPSRGATLEGYVGMVATREVGNIRQRVSAKKRGAHLRAVEEAPDRPDSRPNPEQDAASRQLAARLGAHLEASLPERGQLVLRYTFNDGLEPAEAAHTMGVSLQVVYNWQHKIRALAREFVGGARAARP